jgi:hypothetical protein
MSFDANNLFVCDGLVYVSCGSKGLDSMLKDGQFKVNGIYQL